MENSKGDNTEFKKNRTDAIDRIIQNEIQEKQISGAVIKLLQHGMPLYEKAYGLADIEQNRPMQMDTIFRIFSMTKPITAAAALLLVERGVLDLWNPVSKYLHNYKDQYVLTEKGEQPVKQAMRVWDLLNMTSGLSYPDLNSEVGRRTAKLYDELLACQDKGKRISTVDLAERIGELPLMFSPGETWMYGTSADVLGAVIEVASGEQFGQFLKKEFFDPLEMTDTGFYVPETKRERFAQFYRHIDEPNELKPHLERNLGMEGYFAPPAFESGGAGLVSTVQDYERFASMLLYGGSYQGRRILGRKTVEFMHTNQLKESQRKTLNWDSVQGYGYGNLMRILIDPVLAGSNADIGEFGWDGWCGTYFTIDPAADFLMLYFIQRCDTGCNATTRKLRAAAYSLLE